MYLKIRLMGHFWRVKLISSKKWFERFSVHLILGYGKTTGMLEKICLVSNFWSIPITANFIQKSLKLYCD